jgi:ubiquinone/menaquinone biosynthesis C-methylase UbiE
MDRTPSKQAARTYYERFADRQDQQGWYEDAALDRLIAGSALGQAQAVLEVGCGTGRLAQRLLDTQLSPDARYLGLDISQAMLALAATRLAEKSDKAHLALADATASLPLADRSVDRCIAAYLLDLLPHGEALALIGEAKRVLAPNGLLCLASLSQGPSGLAGLGSRIWAGVQRLAPQWVGGCRPVHLTELLDERDWELLSRETVSPWSVSSEIVIARRL